MRRTAILIVMLLLSSLYYLQAQTSADSIRAQYQALLNELTLLQNQGGLIPLQRLDTLRIAGLNLWLDKPNNFFPVLNRYLPVEEVDKAARRQPEELATLLAEHFNTVIVGLNADHFTGDFLQEASFVERLFMALQGRCNVVLTVFGTGEFWRILNVRAYAQTIIYSPTQEEWGQSVAAQLIFGGVGAAARLKDDLSEQFPMGAGMDSRGGLRFRYAPPEVMGMNGQLLQDSIDAIMAESISKQIFPGAQVIVAKDQTVVFYQAFGHHTYEEDNPVTMDDLYDLASLTKISASLPAIMRFYETGKVNLDAPFSDVYTYWKHSNKSDLTLRAILAHNARLKAWIPFWRNTLRKNGKFRCHTFQPDSTRRYNVKITDHLWLYHKYYKKIFKAIRKSPLNEKPGYVYSDLSFFLWPQIVEHLTGIPFETYLKDTFYKPLGASTLTFNPWRFYPLWRITPTERDTFFRMTLVHGRVHDEGAAMLNGVSGHAGLFGSANDFAKLMQMYLNGGSYGGVQFLQPTTLAEFERCQYCNEGIRRGLGFDRQLIEYKPNAHYVAKSASQLSFGHTGFTGTYGWADPANGLLVVFFTNRVYPARDNPRLGQLNIRPRVQQAAYDAWGATE